MFKPKQKAFLFLAISMAIVVASSNYLVQFPFNYSIFEGFLTYGAFSYPITFLITDLANRQYGKAIARRIVYFGFILGVIITLVFSTNFSDLISIRIAIGSGVAFLTAQLIDVQIFDKLRKEKWFIAPLVSSSTGSIIDTFLFFSIAFYGVDSNWFNLALGDLGVKIFMALIMLIHFRMLMNIIKDTASKYSAKKNLI